MVSCRLILPYPPSKNEGGFAKPTIFFYEKKSGLAKKKSERNPGEGKPSDLGGIIGYYYKLVKV